MTQTSKILHVFDDEIICQSTIDLFKNLTQFSQNYLILSPNPEKWNDLYPNDETVTSIALSVHSHAVLGKKIEEYDIIILQAFSVEKAKAINLHKFGDKVFVWALWGYGLYNIVNYFTPSKSEITTTITKKNIKQKIQNFYTYQVIYRKALRKVKLCVFLLEHDFQLLGKALKHNATWMTACYQTEANLFGKMGPFEVTGTDILIGNSSTPSNRHHFVFNELKKCGFGDAKLIIPLSYGDDLYKKSVINSGHEIFGDQFVPIVNFMELGAYQQMLSSCGHVIMAHERQQAFGTLMMMLIAGAKLYLSIKSPFYAWFKEMGVVIFAIETELKTEIQCTLSQEDRLSNKLIVSGYLNTDKRIQALQLVLERAQKLKSKTAK